MPAASRSRRERLKHDTAAAAAVQMSTSSEAAVVESLLDVSLRGDGASSMDRDYIARNQIVERYLAGRLPLKTAIEFEHFCREHPQLLEEMGLAGRVGNALRLLDASGGPRPWAQHSRRFWEKPAVPATLAVLVLALGAMLYYSTKSNIEHTRTVADLQARLSAQPIHPIAETRTIRLLPSFSGASLHPAIVIDDGDQTLLADLKIDLSRSQFRNFRVTIDRVDQGRFAVLHNLQKDSNGHVSVAFNTSALGPGDYQLTIEGVNWRGQASPEAWVTIGVQR